MAFIKKKEDDYLENRFLNREKNEVDSNESTKNTYYQDHNEIIFDENYDLTKIENMNKYLDFYHHNFKENFELTEYLDNGSTGIVYKGKSLPNNNNQFYAFKFCINLKKNKKPSRNKYHEIIVQKLLHHMFISQILAFYKIGENSFFSVSEFGKFGNLDNFLHKFLKKNFLSETFVNYLSKPILEAINYMHKKKIYHMDIKKGNIVLDSELNPKLIDFSSCINCADYTPDKKFKLGKIGTGRYMPLEILIYNLAFGIYPYGLNSVKGDNYVKICEKLRNSKFDIPKEFEISSKFKEFLKKVLDVDYKNRYSIKDALNDPWIKGWNIINEEKENTAIQENFIIKLISDNIPKFNEYIK